MSTSDLLLLVILVAASSSFTSVSLLADAYVPKEKEAFLDFKNAITADPNGMLESWQPDMENDFCKWASIVCDDLTSQYVVKLELNSVIDSAPLTGEISRSLLSLQHLEYLDLSFNRLQGPNRKIPEFLGYLENLWYLDLSGIPFSGSEPPQLGNLSKLEELYLSECNITGALTASIGKLTNLRTLDLHLNHLSGQVPTEISRLAKLTFLDLGGNPLEGLITEEHLDGLKSLDYIDLSDTNLNITVDSEWLPTFRLRASNFLGCHIGPLFPAWLKLQMNLHVLDVSKASINDRLPDWFSNTFSNVMLLDISKNQITGVLPKNMDTMSLKVLHSSSNNLAGHIPPLPISLNILDVSKNYLSGPLPLNLGGLGLIILYSNNFSGQVPSSICSLRLWGLDLANNHFEGEFPQCLNMEKMRYMLLGNNKFSGNFPPSVRICTALSFLVLSRNRFVGPLPEWIGSCSSLKFLRLSNNLFKGHIPKNITSLTKLYHLDLANNWISGPIPPHLSNLTYPTTNFTLLPHDDFDDIWFKYTVGDLAIDIKRQLLIYHGDAILELQSIDLSSNFLCGNIPEEITSLDRLVNLNLSHNLLNGKISNKIGALLSLESLDLSNNHFSGEIPSSISTLAFDLERFGLV